MKQNGFIKGLFLGLSFTLVFALGRVSANPQVIIPDSTTRMAMALEKIANQGVAVRLPDGMQEQTVRVKLDDAVDVKIEGEVAIADGTEVKVEPKWSTFPVEIKE